MTPSDQPEPAFGATRFARIRTRLESFEPAPGPASWVYEFLLFGFKQGWACLFGGLMLALLLGTHFFYPEDAPLARYDFLTLAALAIQTGMIAFRLESWREVKVIGVFHVVGTVMELFKTHAGSWAYPERGVLHIGAVPLFSGFMYAAVGSYIARIWRIFDIRFTHYPPRWATVLLAAAIYVNFFAHHWLPDMRIALFALTALLYWRTRFYFTPFREARAARLPARLAVHLVRRECRHLRAGLALSEPARRLADGAPYQARRLVSAHDHLGRAGLAAARDEGSGGAGRRPKFTKFTGSDK